MTKILFVMLHPGFIRYYEGAIVALGEAGIHVHVAFEMVRDKLGEETLARRLAARSPAITYGTTPARSEGVRTFLARSDRTALRSGDFLADSGTGPPRAWDALATTLRLLLDYLRYFEPSFQSAVRLRDRAEKRLPPLVGSCARMAVATRPRARRALSRALSAIERVIPVGRDLETFVRRERPDALLVTPLVELGSQQVDYVKCARALGIPSALCVASWDNLTSKGLIRVLPDRVILWNEAQRHEATTLHGVPAEQVVVTGAQTFDHWFGARPSRTREAFCARVGLDPDRPFVLYVGSSSFIAPEEVAFARAWFARVRSAAYPAVAALGVLVRPHPANARQWRALDPQAHPGLSLWPPVGSDPNGPDARRDYVDSIYYCAAVVGINTSAQLEASIVGRPVLTIRAPEFQHSQGGTLHFNYLVDAEGFVRSARDFPEHVAQLAAVLSGEVTRDADRRFVASFIRPHGLDRPATPFFVSAVQALTTLPRQAPSHEPVAVRVLRPPAYLLALTARLLAEGRPLWSYPLRALVGAAVAIAVTGYRIRDLATGRTRATRRGLRRLRRMWHDAADRAGSWRRRTRKSIVTRFRSAGVAAKRVLRRLDILKG